MIKKWLQNLFGGSAKEAKEKTVAKAQRPAPKGKGKSEGGGKRSEEGSGGARNFGLQATNASHDALKEGSTVHIRQLFGNGTRFRVRGEAEDGRKINIVLSLSHLRDFRATFVPPKLRRHYRGPVLFPTEEAANEFAAGLNEKAEAG